MLRRLRQFAFAAALGGCCWPGAASAQPPSRAFRGPGVSSSIPPAPSAAPSANDRSLRRDVPALPRPDLAIETDETGVAATGGLLTLEMLEDLALRVNPTVAEGRAIVRRTQGKQLQAGLYPNPSTGYYSSEVGNSGKAGQEGYFVEQEFVTANKLGLSRNVAAQERKKAECGLAAQQLRVRNAVRREYYSVLTAERLEQLSQELVKIAETSIRITDARLKRGEGTKVDLLQARIEAESARQILTSAENARRGSWKRLKAVVGAPALPGTCLDGDLTAPVPELSWDDAWERLRGTSPQLSAARFDVRRAQAAVRRAHVEPIPNVIATGYHQYDYASNYQIAGAQIGVAIPVFNRNQGNIYSAQAEVAQTAREVDRIERTLERNLATAFQEYATAYAQAERYREVIIPTAQETLDASRALYEAGELSYLQLQTAQRTYTQMNLQYVEVLGRLWKSVVSVDGMLLIDGLASPESLEPDAVNP